MVAVKQVIEDNYNIVALWQGHGLIEILHWLNGAIMLEGRADDSATGRQQHSRINSLEHVM